MYVNTQMNFILILICSCVHISIVSQVLFMWMPLFSVQGVPNTLQSIPRLNIAKQIFKMRVYQVYSHAYCLTIFWITNCSPGIEVAFENFGKNLNFFLNTLYLWTDVSSMWFYHGISHQQVPYFCTYGQRTEVNEVNGRL